MTKSVTFKLYKFRSMYLNADERKAELMKENKMADGKMSDTLCHSIEH